MERIQADVYICYSKWNQKDAAEITEILESSGITCFLVSRDMDYTRSWNSQIEEAIKGSSISLYLKPSEPSFRILEEVELITAGNTRLMQFDPSKYTNCKIAEAVINSIDDARKEKERNTRIYPYNGSDPFIFASYSHRDMGTVFDIIRELQKRGYRIWFDEGIDPGTEWDEYIAGYIAASSYMLAFLSENYFGSSNCKDELSFARDMDKPLLLIYIKDDELPAGMQLRLNRIQAIHWYSYEDKQQFYKKVDAAAGIGKCHEKGEE